MLDIKYIRENSDLVKANIQNKFQDDKIILVDDLLLKDKEYRGLLVEVQNLRAKRNSLSSSINEAKKKGEDVTSILTEAKEIPSKIKAIEEKTTLLEEDILLLLQQIPNMMHESVPIGKDDSENVEFLRFGEPSSESFMPHSEFLEKFFYADFESSRETSGSGFYYLKAGVAELEEALRQYAMDIMKQKNYTYVIPPNMIRSDVTKGVMSFSEMDSMMYKIENEDLFLIGTSEHSLIGMFINKVLKEKALPIKIFANTACYRKEVGSHGLDEKGIFRVHQFNKVEQVILCKPEDSMTLYDELLSNTIDIFKGLEIPIRAVEICSGDMADLKHKSADVEAWSPRKKGWIEVASCSNLTDAQSRRLSIKIDGKDGRYFAHTLNDTAIATSRALVALIENHMREDGSIYVPVALRKYVGKDVIMPYHEWFW